MHSDGPLVVAHRGSSFLLAEHTLAAYEKALTEGADGLECDVRLTRDGHLVCVHDRRLERVSNGRGAVSDRSLDDLHSLDFGGWKVDLPESADDLIAAARDRDYRQPIVDDDKIRDAQRRVLTFDRLLELFVDSSRRVQLYVETKHPTRWGGLVEQRLVASLRRFGLVPDRATPEVASSPVVVMSFSPMAVRRLRELAPSLPAVLLFDGLPRLYREGTLPFGATIAGPGVHVLRSRPRFAERIHAAGNQLYVWTVDEPEDMEFVMDLGANMIATNRPARLLSHLERVV
ncbi:glycerophosphodiester phosphodiesterase family protein [Cryptosporangium aurantiacum]|uniref:Glycerophosphoryl diester phosphodiesterase n=1 Tax=Cryptosporangium aurantiacum TaxID=134849 RepID=A0A1M7RK98_9ACTN|nr:glycerophosphodiester phosphodiesterase family protein [Cryptosporangium aurantiacum]SHN46775.1 glycerophosphoryl diester phosphodiesterase [Cryptosporangium aurantiacum]